MAVAVWVAERAARVRASGMSTSFQKIKVRKPVVELDGTSGVQGRSCARFTSGGGQAMR